MKNNGVSSPSPLNGFLTGLRVLDLSQYIPGPMATLFLADMGADVLKIEPPKGDEMQSLGPRDQAGQPTFYNALNGGKSVYRMNLKDEEDRATFVELVKEADVLVEGFRPGVMQRLRIDYETLSAINSGLIMCSISGYGTNSVDALRAGHDANYLALAGVAHRNGIKAPRFFDPPLADSAGSLFAAMVILGALQGRARSGKGCVIDLALADTVMPLQMMQVADYGATRHVPERGANYLNGGAAYYQIYATSDDRHVVLGSVEPKFWIAFCEAARRPDLIARHGDAMPQTALQAEVAAIFAAMTAAEAEDKFGKSDCCFSIVNDLGEALSSPHVQSRQLVRSNEAGDLQALFPVWVDGAPPESRTQVSQPAAPARASWSHDPSSSVAPPATSDSNVKTGKI